MRVEQMLRGEQALSAAQAMRGEHYAGKESVMQARSMFVSVLSRSGLVALMAGVVASVSAGQGGELGGSGASSGQAGSAIHRATPDEGLTTWTLMSGGVERRYSVYVPGRGAGRGPWPVVVDIHGTGSRPEQELEVSGMAGAAEERGFIVVLPIARVPHPGGGAGWNVPPLEGEADDVAYVGDVLDDVSRRLDVDSRRVFVAGFSGGARLASKVASRLSNRIAALGAVGGLRAPSGAGRPVPVIAFHGTGDPINPFEGGGPDYWGYGVVEAFEGWATRDRCAAGTDTLRVAAGIRAVRRAGGSEESDLRLYVLDGVGHTWPGAALSSLPSGSGEAVVPSTPPDSCWTSLHGTRFGRPRRGRITARSAPASASTDPEPAIVPAVTVTA